MTPILNILKIERSLASGGAEHLLFKPGVNLIVGEPNTGKTTWLSMIDYAFGESDSFSKSFDETVASKYSKISLQFSIDGTPHSVVRHSHGVGAQSNVELDGKRISTSAFQHWLLEQLKIPLVHYPRGKVDSGETWPELSFRSLLRHIYRQQRFWSDLVDLQYPRERHACLLQFLGLAEYVFTDIWGEIVKKKSELEALRAKREDFFQVFNKIIRELMVHKDMQVAITEEAIAKILNDLKDKTKSLEQQKSDIISAQLSSMDVQNKSIIEEYSIRKTKLRRRNEELSFLLSDLSVRQTELGQYRLGLDAELERLNRAQAAGDLFSSLKVTHCPVCDQGVKPEKLEPHVDCYLCHRPIVQESSPEMATKRIEFEITRINAEIAETDKLVKVATKDAGKAKAEASRNLEEVRDINEKLRPSRNHIMSLVQEEVSSIDLELGGIQEQHKQVLRLREIYKSRKDLDTSIQTLEGDIAKLEARKVQVEEKMNMDAAEEKISDGMNEYLNKLKSVSTRKGIWPHAEFYYRIAKEYDALKVGARPWSSALGASYRLYAFIAYHYGLLTLTNKEECHYPGITILDFPPDFNGQTRRQYEQEVIQPFISLLASEEFKNCQVICAGASFGGLTDGVNRQELKVQWIAS